MLNKRSHLPHPRPTLLRPVGLEVIKLFYSWDTLGQHDPIPLSRCIDMNVWLKIVRLIQRPDSNETDDSLPARVVAPDSNEALRTTSDCLTTPAFGGREDEEGWGGG